MIIDRYTKIILTAIAVSLAVLAFSNLKGLCNRECLTIRLDRGIIELIYWDCKVITADYMGKNKNDLK